MRFETLQLHAGQTVDPSNRSRAVPIYANTSFVFESSEEARQVFSGEKDMFVYSRIANPTVAVFEQRMAALEGGAFAVAVSSGQAAQFVALSPLVKHGANVVSSAYLYGGAFNQLKFTFKRLMGVDFRFVGGEETVDDFEKLIDDGTRAIYVESIGNPTHFVPDFEGLSKLAKKYRIPLVVDNTFGAGGALVQPLTLGADVVVESATKWIGGHGNTIAGVVIDAGRFDWIANAEKFPNLGAVNDFYHDKSYAIENGNEKALTRFIRAESIREIGPCLNPFAAFMLLQGLETLSLRVERHVYNAQTLADWLDHNQHIAWVSYLGLASHPHHERAKKYLRGGFGCVLTFGAKPKHGEDKTGDIIDHLRLASYLANVGDTKTLVLAPYYTTHSMLSEEERESALVTKDLIRVSVGTEHVDDIIADFQQAINAVYG